MSTMTKPPVATPQAVADAQRGWRAVPTELWATISIVAIWLAVLFDAIYGPDFVSTSVSGDSTRIPSVWIVGLFACIATVSVGKRAFSSGPRP
jgi:hypothetical protein